MNMTNSKMIDIMDRLYEVRDLNVAALMACSDIGDTEARSGLSRLLGLVVSKVNDVSDDLEKAHSGDAS